MSYQQTQVVRLAPTQVPTVTPTTYLPYQDLISAIFGLMFLMIFMILPFMIMIPLFKALAKSFS